jgi:hypothetical protein
MPSTVTTGTARSEHEAGARAPRVPSAHRGLGLALILTAAFMVVLDSSA